MVKYFYRLLKKEVVKMEIKMEFKKTYPYDAKVLSIPAKIYKLGDETQYVEINVIVDTGCSSTVIHSGVLNALGINVEETSDIGTGANSKINLGAGMFRVELAKDFYFDTYVHTMDDLTCDMLLGIDTLSHMNIWEIKRNGMNPIELTFQILGSDTDYNN